jgi:hypothetical protein
MADLLVAAAGIVVFVAALALAWRFLGSRIAAVFEGRVRWLSLVERPVYRMLGGAPGTGTRSTTSRSTRTGSGASSVTSGRILQSDPSVGYRLVAPPDGG